MKPDQRPDKEVDVRKDVAAKGSTESPDSVCPVCGGPLVSEKCKVVCRSERCRYRIVMTCAEF